MECASTRDFGFPFRGNSCRRAVVDPFTRASGGSDAGPAGKRPRESSDQETDEATFAKQLANELNRRALSGNFAALVLIVDPQTLGQIRRSLHKEVQDRLISEIGKTLTNASIADIQKALS